MFMTIMKTVPRPVRRYARLNILPPVFRGLRALRGRGVETPDVRRYSLAGADCFQGYYDVTPTSPDGGAVLAHVVRGSRCKLNGSEVASVGYFDLETENFTEVGQTTLWCWQLGARLQWVPGTDRSLAFNAVLHGQPCFMSTADGRSPVRICDRPMFDADLERGIGLSLNFGRLAYARPGYGYPVLPDPFQGEALARDDGIILADLKSGETRLLFSMADFAGLVEENSSVQLHYLNAAKLSATGQRFSVLYKTVTNLKHPDDWSVRAIIGGVDGKELSLVPLPGRASHYWWLDDSRIVYTCNQGLNSSYLIYDCNEKTLSPLHLDTPGVDGHPSLHFATGRWVTDTYPDLFGNQNLYIIDETGSRILGSFTSSSQFVDECRCDLHPRWSGDGSTVYFDSSHEGLRAVYAIRS